MLGAKNEFLQNIILCRRQTTLHDYLLNSVGATAPVDDLLRFQFVYAVSAFDKLIHDIVRVGVVQIYSGSRPATPSYLSLALSMEQVGNLSSAVMPPPSMVFDGIIAQRHKHRSFQDPDKVAEALSLIWEKNNKWDAIGAKLGVPAADARLRLKLIVGRRNGIVHEADTDLSSGTTLAIDRVLTNDTTDFLEQLGVAIVDLVVYSAASPA